MSNVELQTELARVVELLEKATPGEWHVELGGFVYSPTNKVCDAGFAGHEPERTANAYSIAAAVNFLRKHGASLLSSHGVGREAVAWISQYSLYLLNECRNDTHNGVVEVWMRPNEDTGATFPLCTTPQPRAEGMVLVTDALVERVGKAWDSGSWNDEFVGSLDAAKAAMLAAAPGEGSGERCDGSGWVACWSRTHHKKCLGCPACNSTMSSVSRSDTRPVFPQGTEPHCEGHEHCEFDCIDCMDELERQRKDASQSSSYKPLHGGRCIPEVK